MFKKILAFIFCLLLSLSADDAKILNILASFEAYVQKTMQDFASPGVAIVIVTPKKVLLCKGFGTREVGKNKPVDGNTIFQIASATKPITAALVGILAANNIVHLDDPVQKYLPDFCLSNNEVSPLVTIHDLITHRIGLNHFAGDTLMKAGLPPEEIVKKFHLLPFSFPFRKEYNYSNQFFGFAGLVIEAATKKSYHTLLQQYIFSPLGMTRSSAGKVLIDQENSFMNRIKALFGMDENIALTHDRTFENQAVCLGLDPLVYVFPSTSGVNTTAHDLGVWLQCLLNEGMHQNKQIVPKEFIHTMFTPTVGAKIKAHDMQFPIDVISNVAYGTGMFIYDYGAPNNSLKIFGHMGGYVGQRALIFICPEKGFAVGILSNLGHLTVSMLPEALRNKFLDLYLNLPERDWSQEYAKKIQMYKTRIRDMRHQKKLLKPEAKKPDADYIGTYTSPLYGKMTIEKDKEGLLLKIKKRSCHLIHFNGNEFNLKAWEFNKNFSRSDTHFIEFIPNANNAFIAYVSFLDEGLEPVFIKESNKTD